MQFDEKNQNQEFVDPQIDNESIHRVILEVHHYPHCNQEFLPLKSWRTLGVVTMIFLGVALGAFVGSLFYAWFIAPFI